MKKFGLLLAVIFLGSALSFGQGARNIRLNEVLTNNTSSLEDGFGLRKAWVELANTAYSSYNVRGMYITTNRGVLNEELSVPERVKLMSIIPSGSEQTLMTARKHLVLFLNASPKQGVTHLAAQVDKTRPLWIALYDGNGVDLIDSVTVPVLQENASYARQSDKSDEWQVRQRDDVTPGIDNFSEVSETKVAKLKREDPHGIGITVLSMGIVFACLSLLYLFFRVLGLFMARRQALKKASKIQPIKAAVKTTEKIVEVGHKTNVMLKDGLKTGGIDKEVYIAVIAMALKQYQEDVHDVESNVITIRPHHSNWNIPQQEEPIILD